MNRWVQTGAHALLIAASLGLAATACRGGDDEWVLDHSVQLPTSATLEDLSRLPGSESYLAAGEAGTLVLMTPEGAELIDVGEVGDVDLHAVVGATLTGSEHESWWVVGDGGVAALSEDQGASWELQDLAGTTADLYGVTIARIGEQQLPVVVGDEFLAYRDSEGLWVEAQPPSSGWGELRDVASIGGRIYAAGLAGALWSTDDPDSQWRAEPASPDQDLLAASKADEGNRMTVVGTDGRVSVRASTGWKRIVTGVDHTFIDVSNQGMLTEDGDVYEVDYLWHFQWVANVGGGARALWYFEDEAMVVVGSGARARYYVHSKTLLACG